MSRKIFVIIFSLIILLPTGQAFGQTTATTLTTTPSPTTTETTISRRDALKNRLMDKKAEVTTMIAEEKEELTAEKAARKAEIDALRMAKKSEMDEARLAFKEQLETITDERKQAIVEKISNRLTETNTNATDRMFEILDKLSAVIVKIEDKITKAKANGIDTTTQEAELENAKLAIDAAIKTVTEQAAMDYIITINDSTTLKNDIGTVVSQHKQDLRTTYEAVRSARTAVRQAAKSLKGLAQTPPINSEATSTPSALPGNPATPTVNPI